MPASRGVCRRCSLPQYRGFAAGADAPATPGRSVDGFEGVFASWALSALRGLFPSRGRALFACEAGGTAEAGMSASRGKFVSSISALRLTDALATPGRSVDGFEGVFVSWALSASRGLFPSRGGLFCVAAREAGRDVGKAGGAAGAGMSASRGKFVSSIAALRLERTLPQRPAGLPPVFSRPFLRRGLCPRPGACPLRGGGLFCVAAREAGRDVGKACRTAGDRPVCVAARGNCDNFRINRLFSRSQQIFTCVLRFCVMKDNPCGYTVLCP